MIYVLTAQITGNPTPDIIVITEMLPKAPNVIISLSLFALSGYSLFANFDPDNYDPAASDTRGVGIFVMRDQYSVTSNPSLF